MLPQAVFSLPVHAEELCQRIRHTDTRDIALVILDARSDGDARDALDGHPDLYILVGQTILLWLLSPAMK